ncbi:AAA family ATPase [bacterium]|nr:AAA family ATPase [bacterium]
MATEKSNKSNINKNKYAKRKLLDSDNESDSDSDSDYTECTTESETEEKGMDVVEYQKFLSKIFPSKYIDKKIEDGENLKNKQNNKIKNKKNDLRHPAKSNSTKSNDNNSSKNKNADSKKPSSENVNIILTIDGGKRNYDSEDYDDETEDGSTECSTEDEDVEVSTSEDSGSGSDDDEDSEDDDSEDDDSEDDDSEDDDSEDDEESDKIDIRKDLKHSKYKKDKKKHTSNKKGADKEDKIVENDDTLNNLQKLLEVNPNDKYIQKCVKDYTRKLKEQHDKNEKKSKKQKAKNVRIFSKILKDKNSMNDVCFYGKKDLDYQTKIIKELKQINKISRIEKPYRMTLLETEMPIELKAIAMRKINTMRHMEPGSGEYYKNKNWVDTFMRIPFNNYKSLPITFEDGVDKCHDFMEKSKNSLEKAVYGLNDAKMQIMQMMGQLITNPNAIGNSIAIHGPPGTGKTSLVKEGISQILNRPFTFIALGGATDSSFLEGHGYTYEGSTWGKIVQILIESKCMNPVIYFDELDKISDTPKGEEIAGILTHLTDTTQNSQFHDKYFTEINFDLSKCLFIFSYNDETKVNPILKDRMYKIKTNGYSAKDKKVIAKKYLLPKIMEQVKFKEEEIMIDDEVLGHIIETHCNKESGVRNLKRCLEIIYTKLNLYRLMKPETNLFEENMSLKVEFPYTVTKNIVDKLIKRESDGLESWRALYL